MNSLLIHFLNVGHGDCTIVEFPEHLTMVDVNASRALDDETRTELEEKIAALWSQRRLSCFPGSRLGNAA